MTFRCRGLLGALPLAGLAAASCAHPEAAAVFFRPGQVWWTVALGLAALLILAGFDRRGEPDVVLGWWVRQRARLDGGGFVRTVTLLCLLYLALQVVYMTRLPLADDEFAGIDAVHRLESQLPYRDFIPYKTVIGYYLQLPPLLLTEDLWTGIVLVRLWMAVLNAALLIFVALALRRHFRGSAICLGLGLLVVMSTFLERSSVIRVDMSTSWCGLLALLFLLDRRIAGAGLLAGLTFLVSQKGVYFILAGDAALGLWWLLSDRGRRSFRDLALYNVVAVAVIGAYFGLWSLVSSFEQVVLPIFRISAEAALTDYPLICPRTFWLQTLFRNPAFYGVALFSLIKLGQSLPHERRRRDWILTLFGGCLLALCVWHKQPCPNFFIFLVPTLFVVSTAFLDRALAGEAPPAVTRRLLALYLVAGILFPLTRLQYTLPRDSGFQRSTVRLAEALLQPGEVYLASLPLLYDRDQAMRELMWLDDIRRRRLAEMPAGELRRIIDELDRTPLKLIVANYRMWDVPRPLLAYMHDNYDRFWGNVYLYAPRVTAQRQELELKFGGRYRLEVGGDAPSVAIDGDLYSNGDVVSLEKGRRRVAATADFRLRFLPETLDPTLLDPRFKEPQRFFDMSFSY